MNIKELLLSAGFLLTSFSIYFPTQPVFANGSSQSFIRVTTWNSSIINNTSYKLSNFRVSHDYHGWITNLINRDIKSFNMIDHAYKIETNYLGQISQDVSLDVLDQNNNTVGICVLHAGVGSYFASPDFTGSHCLPESLNLHVNPRFYINKQSSLYSEYKVAYTISPKKEISRMFIFGDSLSDNGNLYNMTMGKYPISPP